MTDTTKQNLAAQVRALLAQNLKPKEIALLLNTTPQYVYGVRYYERAKAEREKQRRRQAKAQANIISTTPQHQPIYIEVPVPQPFSHYTFWQRLRILFLGGTA